MATYTAALVVLIIDDEPLLRWAIRQTLGAAGHIPLEVGTAREAMDVVSRTPPIDVILLDSQLPDCQDFELLTSLRTSAPDAAIIMMTAYDDAPGFATHAMRLGANRVLAKPFDMNILPPLVEQLNRFRPI